MMAEDSLLSRAVQWLAQASGLKTGSQIRPLLLLTWLPALLSLCLLLGVLGLAMHVRLGLGHWPKPMWENYATPAFKFHAQSVIWFGLFTVYGAAPLWLFMLCFKPLRISLPIHFRQVLVYGLGWLLLLIYTQWDPFRFVQWYLD